MLHVSILECSAVLANCLILPLVISPPALAAGPLLQDSFVGARGLKTLSHEPIATYYGKLATATYNMHHAESKVWQFVLAQQGKLKTSDE